MRQNRTRSMESWNRLTAVRGEVERRGRDQRTRTKDSQTWTTVWGLSMEVGGPDSWRGAKREKLGQLNSINNKTFFKILSLRFMDFSAYVL